MMDKKYLFLLLLFTYHCLLSAQYSIEVGSYEFLDLNPPAGWVRSANWSCDAGLALTSKSEAGAVVNVTHYFSGAAYVSVSYVYEYVGTYDGNYHAGTGSKSYRITCVGGTASISENDLELRPGQSRTLQCIRSNGYGTPTWESSNENVVTVNKNGKLQAVAPGSARITLDPITAPLCYCNVRVTKVDPQSIELSPNPLFVVVEKTKSLNAVLSPNGATSSLKWMSENESIATVSLGGVVKGISEGKTIVTATTENGKSAKSTIEVVGAPRSVQLPHEVKLSVGYYYTLKPVLTPNHSEATYVWKSSDTSIATVSSTGRIYAKKQGLATISVTTDNNLSATVNVQVVAPPTELDNATKNYRVKTINTLVNKIRK